MEINKEILQSEMIQWINEFNHNGSLMLTISEPHKRLKGYAIEGTNLEPIIAQIIKLSNASVFKKNIRHESLDGLIVEESPHFRPHYHILFSKPEKIEFDVFKKRLSSIANLMCNENFKFDLSKSNFSQKTKERISKPCYDGYAKVSDYHENLASYLTKDLGFANYYMLQGRGFSREKDKLALRVTKYFKKPIVLQ